MLEGKPQIEEQRVVVRSLATRRVVVTRSPVEQAIELVLQSKASVLPGIDRELPDSTSGVGASRPTPGHRRRCEQNRIAGSCCLEVTAAKRVMKAGLVGQTGAQRRQVFV